ncbi:MAG: hypothetical protein JNM93_09655 [Bacteriovoracaceae bacterium]|nr:hypothetical protein [Bacteriovoracaceae bacterium]
MKFILLFLLPIFTLHAADMEMCLTQAEDFKNKNGIEAECFSLVKAAAQSEQKSSSQKIQAFAYKNFLFAENQGQRLVIAGDKTNLGEIHSIKISQNEKWLAVIQNNADKKEILVFPTNRNGNIAPYKVYAGDEFQNIIDLAFHESLAEIYFLDGKTYDVFAVSEDSDSRMLIDSQKPIKLRSYDKNDLMVKKPSQIELTNESLLVFDENEQKLGIIPIDKNLEKHVQNILAPGLKNNVAKIRLRDNQTLDVFTQDETEKAQIELERTKAKSE